jgi:hypothetical protein
MSPVLISYPKLSDDTVVEVVTDNELSNECDCSRKARNRCLMRTYSNRCTSHCSKELFDHTTEVTQQARVIAIKKILSTLATQAILHRTTTVSFV